MGDGGRKVGRRSRVVRWIRLVVNPTAPVCMTRLYHFTLSSCFLSRLYSILERMDLSNNPSTNMNKC